MRSLLFSSLLLAAAVPASAGVITFDDLGPGSAVVVHEGYQGFKWEKYDPLYAELDGSLTASTITGSYAIAGLGFQFSKVNGQQFGVQRLLLRDDLCGEFCSGNSVGISAFRGGTQVYFQELFTEDFGHGPAVIDLALQDIDVFRIESTAIEWFVVDDIEVSEGAVGGGEAEVSEPASVGMLLLGVVALLEVQRRKNEARA